MLSTTLFRQEALDAQSAPKLGTVRLATPVSHQVWALAALGMAGCIVAWLLMGHYPRREHVTGSLVPQAGLISLSARAIGTVVRMPVMEGATVHAGDALVFVSGERSSAAMGDTSADISTQLRQEQSRLQTGLNNTGKLAEEQADDLRMQKRMQQQQIQQLDAQIAIEQHEADDLASLLQRFQGFATKGYISPLQIQEQRSQELDAEQQVKALTRQRGENELQLQTAADQLTQLPLATAAKLDDVHHQIAQDNQALAQNEAERETVLRAPEDGVITTVLVKPGQAVTVGQPLLAIMPQGSPLEAQLLVPSSAIGFVHEGTPVVLHYPAFPYQKFGVHHGTVVSISRSALTPSEITTLSGQQPPQEALYRVQVQLEQQSVLAYGRMELLKPGMVLDADLMLDRRRMAEWIFEPLYGMARRWGGSH